VNELSLTDGVNFAVKTAHNIKQPVMKNFPFDLILIVYEAKLFPLRVCVCVCVCVCAFFVCKHTQIYRVIQNDCRGFNNLSYTIHLR